MLACRRVICVMLVLLAITSEAAAAHYRVSFSVGIPNSTTQRVFSGTSFCIGGWRRGEYVFLTNRHCIEQEGRLYDPRIEIDGRWVPATLLFTDKGFDVAAMRVEYDGHVNQHALARADAQQGDLLWFDGMISGAQQRYQIGDRADVQTKAEGFAIAGLVQNGDSGSPIVNSRGECVGMLASCNYLTRLGKSDPDAWTWCVRSSTLRRMFELMQYEGGVPSSDFTQQRVTQQSYHKPTLTVFRSKLCAACNRFEADMLFDKNFREQIERCFIVQTVTVDELSSVQQNVTTTPTFRVAGKPLDIRGYEGKRWLLDHLKPYVVDERRDCSRPTTAAEVPTAPVAPVPPDEPAPKPIEQPAIDEQKLVEQISERVVSHLLSATTREQLRGPKGDKGDKGDQGQVGPAIDSTATRVEIDAIKGQLEALLRSDADLRKRLSELKGEIIIDVKPEMMTPSK